MGWLRDLFASRSEVKTIRTALDKLERESEGDFQYDLLRFRHKGETTITFRTNIHAPKGKTSGLSLRFTTATRNGVEETSLQLQGGKRVMLARGINPEQAVAMVREEFSTARPDFGL